ncbi:MAG: gluconate 2-dehydrogenase subunit 3 family protein [Pseudomonadota bacterium]
MGTDGNPLASFQPSRRKLLELGAWLGVALVASVSMPDAYAAGETTLAPSDLALIGDVAELIIPATDTGGAKQAEVPAFIGLMVTRWFHPDERDNFLSGMAEFATGAVTKYGKPFTALTPAQQTEYFGGLLHQAEAQPAKPASLSRGGAKGAPPPPWSPFVVLMKRLTIFGYYTSELGGSVELSLNIIPNEYVPEATVRPGERADSYAQIALPPFSAR